MTANRIRVLLLILLPATATLPAWAEPDIRLEQTARGVTIRVGDAMFTEYLFRGNAQPVLWPLIGPTGAPYTRSYPLGPAQPGEQAEVFGKSI